jgi:hypothetical protein
MGAVKMRADGPVIYNYVCGSKICTKFGGATLRDPEEAHKRKEDEKKLRTDSPAISDYTCLLKSCKRVWGGKTDGGFLGDKGLGITDHKKMGISVRSQKRSRGQDWLMGELGGRKVNDS